MFFDRFDIIDAYYLFYVNYHGGQFSREYKRMCNIRKYFSPGPCFSFTSLSENAKLIYRSLERKFRRAG